MKQYLALRASAGSGKTFALALRYVYLLCKGAKPLAGYILTLLLRQTPVPLIALLF